MCGHTDGFTSPTPRPHYRTGDVAVRADQTVVTAVYVVVVVVTPVIDVVTAIVIPVVVVVVIVHSAHIVADIFVLNVMIVATFAGTIAKIAAISISISISIPGIFNTVLCSLKTRQRTIRTPSRRQRMFLIPFIPSLLRNVPRSSGCVWRRRRSRRCADFHFCERTRVESRNRNDCRMLGDKPTRRCVDVKLFTWMGRG